MGRNSHPLGKSELDSLKSTLDRLATWIRSEEYKQALADYCTDAGGSKPVKRGKTAAEKQSAPAS